MSENVLKVGDTVELVDREGRKYGPWRLLEVSPDKVVVLIEGGIKHTVRGKSISRLRRISSG